MNAELIRAHSVTVDIPIDKHVRVCTYFATANMDNLEAYESEIYSKAKPLQYSMSSRLEMLLKIVYLFIKISCILSLELCENFIKLFTGSKIKNIANQTALVTGGANGLGRAIACRLAEEKCNIVISDINYNEAIKTAEFIEKEFKVVVKVFKIDVSKIEEIEELKKNVESSLGHVDILINNAGVMPVISLREGFPKDIQKIVDVNLTSHFWVSKILLSHNF